MSIKISELPVASTIGDNDIIPIVQESTTKSIKYEKFKPTIETTINSSSTNDNPVGAKAVYDYSAPIDHASESTTYGQGTETKYGHCKTINNVTSASYVAGESLSAYQGKVLQDGINTLTANLEEYENTTVPELLNAKEDKSNKTNVLDSNSTETQYPNAKVTYEAYAQLLDQIPTNTATGTTINVQDSSNLPLKDFSLLGNAEQFTTTGKNLFDKDNYNAFNGYLETSTSKVVSADGNNIVYIPCKKNTNYTVSKVVTKRFGVGCTVDVPANNVAVSQLSNNYTATSITITTTAEANYLVAWIRNANISGEVSLENVLNSLQIEEGSTATTYEPYTGGKASPNPDYPQDIHVVTGDNTVKVVGKNLFDKNNINANKGVNTANGGLYNSTTSFATFYIPITTTTYYCNGLSNSSYIYGALYDKNKNFIEAISTQHNTNKNSFTILNDNAKFMRLQFLNEYLDSLQIEIGTTATAYEPYTETTQLLSLGDIELAKIGTYTDRIFKAVQGNTIYDSLDSTTKASLTVGSWYKQGNVNKIIWDGTETDWGMPNSSSYPHLFQKSATDYNLPQENTNTTALSNYYTCYNGSNVINQDGFSLFWNGVGYFARITNMNLTTKQGLLDWLEEHNTIIYAKTIVPTYTEITDTTLIAQLENVLKMHTNKNVTNISIVPTGTNAEGELVVEYRVDLGTVIGNINNAIISLGGNV